MPVSSSNAANWAATRRMDSSSSASSLSKTGAGCWPYGDTSGIARGGDWQAAVVETTDADTEGGGGETSDADREGGAGTVDSRSDTSW